MKNIEKFAGRIATSAGILSLAASFLCAQSAPPAPPTPPAPPSATIPTPGVPQFTPMPMVEMNAPFGAAPTTSTSGSASAATGASGQPGTSILVMPMQAQPSTPTNQPALTVPAQTPLLLALERSIHLRTARVGDAVYLRTEFPVAAGRHVAIPAGSYVQGTLLVVRPHVANIRLTQLILPSGAVLPLANAPSAACTILLRSASGVLSHGRHIDTCLPHALSIPQPHAAQPAPPQPSSIPVPILVQPPAFNTNSSSTGTAAGSAGFIKK